MENAINDIAQAIHQLRRAFASFNEESEQFVHAMRNLRVSLNWWYYINKYNRTPWVFFWQKLYYKHKAAQVLKKHRDEEEFWANMPKPSYNQYLHK